MDRSLGGDYSTTALLLTSSASPPPPPPPSDLAAGRNYLCFWSFYQTAREFPKHLEQLMELEWSVTLRVETGSWKQRHPVGLMLESGTWEELSSNPHSTCEGNDLEKFQQDPDHTPVCLWVLLPSDHPWRRSHQCSPVLRIVAPCCEGQCGCFGHPDPKHAPMSRLGAGLEGSQYFGKGNEGPGVIWRLSAWHPSQLKY